MALNATTCYNKSASYDPYPSPGATPSVVASSGSYRAKDFHVPLHVDCSVEYEMPSSAKPPTGGKIEPLLMIHPSYYRKAESRTRPLFVNNMPTAATVSSSSGSRRMAARSVPSGGADTTSIDGPPPAKKPYAGPAPGVTASTAYGMVAGAVAAAAGASQWPPLGSSAELQHHDGKRTLDMVQQQYQQHLPASLPPPMMTAALPTDKTHLTVSKGCSCCQVKLKRKTQQQPQPQHLQMSQLQQQQSHIQQQQQQQQQQHHHHHHHHHQHQQQQLQQQQHLHYHQQQQQQQHQQHLHQNHYQQHHQQEYNNNKRMNDQQQQLPLPQTAVAAPTPALWGFNGTIAAVLRSDYGGKPAKTLGRITEPINNILTPTYMF
ncbi:histone-lysine N-methyltransferase, H3 lysine-79 specific-like [Daktulosphaira vitifoliae]|uniref:histone-lysine N-methyltransferase, H3 lysine-79 specific-like n=1 Tax=Daktulosphaira vitifoliae TaxID=58002 RepID=UPI0021A99C08|nr:histone-lysine N-methyltransferase, H3 lysine-79 specific-like [Daktulosphaira vitifoliae]